MKTEKLIRMANQIAGFFAHEGPERGAASTADHLKKFWDPRMRTEIAAAVAEGRATGLDPIALAAVRKIAAPHPG
ncbi:MAG: formate dehydrogenase subunit delta [Gammaproteobacteria bacterium]